MKDTNKPLDRTTKIQIAHRIDLLAELHAWFYVNGLHEEAEQIHKIACKLAKYL